MDHFKTIIQCRVCGGSDLRQVLDLGHQYIANAFHAPNDPPTLSAPLCLIRCASCSAVQLAHAINTDLMYKTYWYRSGVNDTMRYHLKELVESIEKMAMIPHFLDLRAGDIAVDIGCNDGTMLQAYDKSIVKIGVDPSNITPVGCDVFINDYFSAQRLKPYLSKRKAKVITSISMFYDLNDPKAFARDIHECLDDRGMWVVELSYLPFMLNTVSYDTICHEHVMFYRITTFNQVLDGTGLEVIDAEFNDVNGGSIRFYVSPVGCRKASTRYKEALKKEFAGNYDRHEPYDIFREKVSESESKMRDFLADCTMNNKKVYGYGASTKGQIIMQHCDISSKYMIAVAERNPKKFGLLTPGTNVPICSENEMRSNAPDYLIIFPWYFINEFKERETDLLKSGTKFVVPLPEFTVIGAPREDHSA